MRKEYAWPIGFILIAAATVLVLRQDELAGTPIYPAAIHFPEIALIALSALFAVAVYYRLPWTIGRASAVAEIEPFISVLSQSKFNGTALAARLLMMIEQQVKFSPFATTGLSKTRAILSTISSGTSISFQLAGT